MDLRRLIGGLRRTGRRGTDAASAGAAREHSATPAGADESYRTFWDAMARSDAFTAIFSQPDGGRTAESAFDASGRNDAERLRRFVTSQSIVLDVGCGIGRIDRYLATYCARLHGVDVSDEMLRRAREWTAGCPNVELHRASAVELSVFSDATFDFVFCLLVLQHLDYEDAFLALREIARVLKPLGQALVQFPNLESAVYSASFVQQALTAARLPGRMRLYTPDFATRLMHLAGLEVVGVERRPGGETDPNEIDLIARRARVAGD